MKHLWINGRVAYGIWTTLADPVTIGLAGRAGFEYTCIATCSTDWLLMLNCPPFCASSRRPQPPLLCGYRPTKPQQSPGR